MPFDLLPKFSKELSGNAHQCHIPHGEELQGKFERIHKGDEERSSREVGRWMWQRADNFRKRLKMSSAAKAMKSDRKITKTGLLGLAEIVDFAGDFRWS